MRDVDAPPYEKTWKEIAESITPKPFFYSKFEKEGERLHLTRSFGYETEETFPEFLLAHSISGKKTPAKKRKYTPASMRPSSGGSKMTAIELMQMLPASKAIVRVQDGFQQKKSAANHLYSTFPVTWNNAAATINQDITPITDYYLAMFRDPLRAAVVQTRQPAPNHGTSWSYGWISTLNNNATEVAVGGPNPEQGPNFNLPTKANTMREFVNPTGAVPVAGTFQPHGSILFAGRDGLRTGIWVDCNSVAQASITMDAGAGFVFGQNTTCNLYRWQSGWRLYQSQVATTLGGQQTLVFSGLQDPGYYSLGDLFFTGGSATKFTVVQAMTADSWAHICLPQGVIQTSTSFQPQTAGSLLNFNSVTACRLLGYSCLFSNRTPDQFKTGTVQAISSDIGETWMEYLIDNGGATPFGAGNTATNQSFVNNGVDEELVEMSAVNGLYAWGKTTSLDDIKYRKPFQFDEDTLVALRGEFNIVDDSPFFVIQLRQPPVNMAPSANTTTSPLWQVHFDWIFEFHTNNQWFEQHFPTATVQEFENAARNLAERPQFTSSRPFM